MLEDYFTDDFGFEEYNKLDEDVDFEVGNFFRDKLVKTRKAVTVESFNKFSALNENGPRVAFILSYPEAHELPIEVENYEKKDSTKTKTFKGNGNSAFGLDHYEVAIDEYNKAVLVAPKDELGVILANRSAAFYHLNKYDLALRDCDEALKVGYPKHLMFKLEERRARCLLGLKSHTKAIEAFQNALRFLDDAQLVAEKKRKNEADIRIMLNMMGKSQQMIIEQGGLTQLQLEHMEYNRLREKDAIPRIKDRNPLYPNCSTAVEIKDSCGDVGRYAVATKDIQPGEILVVEKPHCASILEEHRRKHCHRCSITIITTFPAACYKCSSIAYCSPKCRNADEHTHLIECDLLGALWCSHASITCILALRAVIQKPFEELIKVFNELKSKNGKFQVSKAKPYFSKDYKAFYNLVTHEDKRTTEDLFHRAFMAAWLFRVLKTSSYFPENVKTTDSAETQLSEAEIIVAGAILHHLQLLQFNSHEISEFVRKKGSQDLSKGKSFFIGGGVYPTVALFNHSCNPGIVRYFIGNTIIVRAIRSIPAGAEISENYGPIFTEVKESERKRTLRVQYWFDCNCEACKNHWPLLDEIDPNKLGFKCDTGPSCGNILYVNMESDNFMITCSKCGKGKNIMKGLKDLQDTDALYKIASKNIKSGDHEESLNNYLKILKILDATLVLPIKDYHLCQQGIRQCVLALGNCSTVR